MCRSFRADECFASNEAAISRPAPIDDDDIENLIVTPDGNSVITFSSLNGRFVKQWNTQARCTIIKFDLKYRRIIDLLAFIIP